MDRKFLLSCCSTVDLPYDYMDSREIPVLSYTYLVDGVEYVDDMGRDPASRPHPAVPHRPGHRQPFRHGHRRGVLFRRRAPRHGLRKSSGG